MCGMHKRLPTTLATTLRDSLVAVPKESGRRHQNIYWLEWIAYLPDSIPSTYKMRS